MSFCRFSSDDFQCDLYVYENMSGSFVTHVAKLKLVLPELPEAVPLTEQTVEQFVSRMQKVSEVSRSAPRVELGLPYDGASFIDDSLTGLQARLFMLREAGYRYPAHVDVAIRNEIEDSRKPQPH